MIKFEIVCVNLFKGNFKVSVMEGVDVVDVMVKYFEDDGIENLVRRDVKENKSGGWYMKFEEESFVIRML